MRSRPSSTAWISDTAGEAYAAGLTLAERVTGVRLTGALPGGIHRRAVPRPVPQDLVPESMIGHPALDEPCVRGPRTTSSSGSAGTAPCPRWERYFSGHPRQDVC